MRTAALFGTVVTGYLNEYVNNAVMIFDELKQVADVKTLVDVLVQCGEKQTSDELIDSFVKRVKTGCSMDKDFGAKVLIKWTHAAHEFDSAAFDRDRSENRPVTSPEGFRYDHETHAVQNFHLCLHFTERHDAVYDFRDIVAGAQLFLSKVAARLVRVSLPELPGEVPAQFPAWTANRHCTALGNVVYQPDLEALERQGANTAFTPRLNGHSVFVIWATYSRCFIKNCGLQGSGTTH